MKRPSLEEQLGYYVGEHIVSQHLPTLSTDSIRTRKVIQVSEEETKENERLGNLWFKTAKGDGRDELWKNYREHSVMLANKYYPRELTCYVKRVEVNDMTAFKNGISKSLWDCDACAYSLKLEDIKIENQDHFTVIKFVLDVTVGEL